MTDFLSAVKPQELRSLYRQARLLGCSVETTKGQHIRISVPGHPSPIYGPYTSRHGVERTVRAKLRRAGLDI